jgi:V8-like Glu-specific endopeptidase
MPVGCTAWMFNDPNHTFLTAGHCSSTSSQVMEFNVPLSTSNGGLVHPGPEDQYAVDAASLQEQAAGLGNDYGYFGCFANTNTGLTPYERQQAFYILAPAAPAVNGQSIRITGYGVDSSPSSYNQVQQTSNGPYFSLSGTIIKYQCDTAGGNSGSAVLDESTQRAIGIHTNGGCGSSSGSANSGCAINVAGLQEALSNPQGVCIPSPKLCAGDVVRNQVVDIDDLLAVVGQFGGPGGVPADAAPLGGDGLIDVADILQVINDWGDCP